MVALVPLFSFLVGCADDPEPDNHGSIRVELSSSAGGSEMFAGTKRIALTVDYGVDCLEPFYEDQQPSWGQDGIDGAPVFEEWKSRLCDSDEFPTVPECEVILIEQYATSAGRLKLRIDYEITKADNMNLKDLRVGPLPVDSLAGCSPVVEITALAIQGYDNKEVQQGTRLWTGVSQSHSRVSTNEGMPVSVTVKSEEEEEE